MFSSWKICLKLKLCLNMNVCNYFWIFVSYWVIWSEIYENNFKNYTNFKKRWSSTSNWILKEKNYPWAFVGNFFRKCYFRRHGWGEQEILVSQVNDNFLGKEKKVTIIYQVNLVILFVKYYCPGWYLLGFEWCQ